MEMAGRFRLVSWYFATNLIKLGQGLQRLLLEACNTLAGESPGRARCIKLYRTKMCSNDWLRCLYLFRLIALKMFMLESIARLRAWFYTKFSINDILHLSSFFFYRKILIWWVRALQLLIRPKYWTRRPCSSCSIVTNASGMQMVEDYSGSIRTFAASTVLSWDA